MREDHAAAASVLRLMSSRRRSFFRAREPYKRAEPRRLFWQRPWPRGPRRQRTRRSLYVNVRTVCRVDIFRVRGMKAGSDKRERKHDEQFFHTTQYVTFNTISGRACETFAGSRSTSAGWDTWHTSAKLPEEQSAVEDRKAATQACDISYKRRCALFKHTVPYLHV
jgi:hypothetical protein